MLLATLICSDPACAIEAQSESASCDELEDLLCDCGCELVALDWAARDEGDGDGRDLAAELARAEAGLVPARLRILGPGRS